MTDAAHTESTGSSRIWLSRLLLAMFLLSAALSVVALWSRNQVLDTDRFVRTVSPLADDPNIQIAVSDKLAVAVTDEVQSLLASGDEPLLNGPLAGPINLAVDQFVQIASERVVSSAAFAELWNIALREAHASMELALTGGDTDVVVSEEGQVSIDLTPMVEQLRERLVGDGFGLSDRLPDDLIELQYVLFESDDLASLQQLIDVLDRAAWWLPIVALITLGGYLIASPERWRAAVRSMFGFAVAMVVLLLLVALTRWEYLRRLDPEIDQATAAAVFDILTNYLRRAIRILAVAGFALAGLLALVRPRIDAETGATLGVRNRLSRFNDSARSRYSVIDGVENFIARNRTISIAVFVAIIALIVVGVNQLSWGWMLVLAVIAISGVMALLAIPSTEAESEEAVGTIES